jgi:FkbM family methyltransferase
MDLFFNQDPRFTKWLVRSGALREPFVVIDVGVQGGAHPRWHLLGEYLIFHGFDAIKEVVEELTLRNPNVSNKTFHWLAIGNEDGEREFYFNPGNPTNSSFYQSSFQVVGPAEARKVPVRKLDTLLRDGVVPSADFIKVDVEGFEAQVFQGAAGMLANGVLGVEAETNFFTSASYPESRFALVQAALSRSGLVLFDLGFTRVPRATYNKARQARGMSAPLAHGSGKATIFDVLFCRDLTAERDGSLYYTQLPAPPTVDQILKTIVIYELHGLNDVAFDTAAKFSAELGRRVDVERALDLLCHQTETLSEDHTTLRQQLHSVYASTSWRITAPLRVIANNLKRRS